MKCGSHSATTMTSEVDAPRRLPAEWEPAGGVLIAWPHEATDWAYMLDDVQRCYDSLVRAVARHAVAVVIAPDTSALRSRFSDIPADRIIFYDVPTNDTWTRDYGPISVRDASGRPIICDFGFNAWGGKFAYELDNAVTAAMVRDGLLTGCREDCGDYWLEGGSIESNGRGTILTTDSCMLTDTRNGASRADVEARLHRSLGANHVLWLDHGYLEGDDTDGHIDTIARLAPDDVIIYCASAADETDTGYHQHHELELMRETLSSFRRPDGQPYNLIELPLPDPIYDADGQRLPATYANFLVLNDAVLMPVYGQPRKDLLAEMTLQVAFPDHVIERVDCRALIQQHGSLHCATMQLPKDILPV